MPLLELDKVTREAFAPHVGEVFEVVFSDGRLPLTLADTRSLGTVYPGAKREPFALTFHGAPTLRLPQHIYRLEHPALGAMEIFLVQTGADAAAAQIEAVFN